MTIHYDQFRGVNVCEKVVVVDVEKVSCHKNNIYYWKKGQPNFMYRLYIDDFIHQNVRITDE